MVRRIFVVILTAAGLCWVTPHDGRAEYDPKVGQRHADFLLPTIGDRDPVALSQFRGRKVLLIHFASW
jgi:hypothetical protein